MLAAKQRSLYELTDAISAKDKARALAVLDAMLQSGEGEDAAIGHLYMLARTFRQMLVIQEKGVRDSRAIWQALWQGFRLPPFAAEDVIRQARRYKSRRDLTRALKLIAPEVSGEFGDLMEWADGFRTLKVRTNADNPRDAKHYGIETIYQTLGLADNVDAAANLFLGREILTKWGTLDDVAMEAEARKVMGMAVFSGMLVATILGVLLVPMLFVMVEKIVGGAKQHAPAPAAAPAAVAASHGQGSH